MKKVTTVNTIHYSECSEHKIYGVLNNNRKHLMVKVTVNGWNTWGLLDISSGRTSSHMFAADTVENHNQDHVHFKDFMEDTITEQNTQEMYEFDNMDEFMKWAMQP